MVLSLLCLFLVLASSYPPVAMNLLPSSDLALVIAEEFLTECPTISKSLPDEQPQCFIYTSKGDDIFNPGAAAVRNVTKPMTVKTSRLCLVNELQSQRWITVSLRLLGITLATTSRFSIRSCRTDDPGDLGSFRKLLNK